jgi:hypothetical protein
LNQGGSAAIGDSYNISDDGHRVEVAPQVVRWFCCGGKGAVCESGNSEHPLLMVDRQVGRYVCICIVCSVLVETSSIFIAFK